MTKKLENRGDLVEVGQIFEIPLDLIDAVDRIRPVDPAKAATIAKSIDDARQISPIEVRATEGGRYRLVAGAHRMAACQLLERQTIEAVLFQGSLEEARLREVDENLYRADLTASERKFFGAERLRFYTYTGGELRRGRDARKSANLADLENPRFYKDVEEKFGIAERTARRLLRRSRNIAPALWEKIQQENLGDKGNLLDKVAELEADAPGALLETMEQRGCTLKAAISLCSAGEAKDPRAERLRKFRSLLEQASLDELNEFQTALKAKIREKRL
jgi:ParB family chromosome partitioning protein